MNNHHWLQSLLNGVSLPSGSPTNSEGDPDATTPQQLDSFLANAMAQLNVQQRESILEELHGIQKSENPEGDPATVEIWLQMLDIHIQNIKRGTVYEVAEAIDRAYVTRRSFRMMFLRASRYDPEAAAVKVINFLNLKRSLFGQEKLTKKITLVDLQQEDKEHLASGSLQISTERDRSGRQILIFFPSLHGPETPTEVMLRARYYLVMSMMESEHNQKNGLILIYFGAMPSKPNQHSPNQGILWDLPVFYTGIHCCLNEFSFYILMSVAILRLPFNLRPRIRIHYGSCAECLYKLSSFGIAREAILTESDEPRLVDHAAWYRGREEMELTSMTDIDTKAESVSSVEITPRPADVLFGSGSRKNKGNLAMRNLVLEMLDEYNSAGRGKKMQLAEHVSSEMKKKGARFLKQNEETKQWEEVSDVETCNKVAHTFRNFRRPSRAQKKA